MFATIIKTTAFHELPSTIHDGIIPANNNEVFSSAGTIMTNAVKMMTNDINAAVYFADIAAESSADITKMTILYPSPSYDIDTESSTIIMVTTVFHESLSAIHNGINFAVNGETSSTTSANEAQDDYYYSDTAVSIASPSIVIHSESSIVIDTESSIDALKSLHGIPITLQVSLL